MHGQQLIQADDAGIVADDLFDPLDDLLARALADQ